MRALNNDVVDALSADVMRIFKERYPDELAHAQAVHARSEKLVLVMMFSTVALWFLGPVLFLNGLINQVVVVMVPGLMTLAFLVVVLVAIVRNKAAARPVVEYAKQLGQNVTSVTKKGINVAVPKGTVTVPEEFRETRRVTRQP
jgi:hypothetical protein